MVEISATKAERQAADYALANVDYWAEKCQEAHVYPKKALNPLNGVIPPKKSVTPSVTVTAETVTGGRILDEIIAFIRQYVSLPGEQFLLVIALWIMHTWIAPAMYTTPRLVFSSPEKRSGKTRAQEVAALLCPNAVNTINVSPAYLFRKLQPEEGEQLPTIFIDEADALFAGKPSESTESVRAILNAGYKRGNTVGRAEIKKNGVETHDYPVFAPVCLAGIGQLPDTIEDRAIIIHMKRRKPGTTLKPYRDRFATAEAEPIRSQLEAWATDQLEILQAWTNEDYPSMPDSIQDRDADVWEPLFIAASLIGGKCSDALARIAPAIVGEQHCEPQSLGEKLLYDIRRVFDATGQASIFSMNLQSELSKLEESSWATLGDKGIDTRFITKTLKPYEIGHHGSPYTVKINGVTARGYSRVDFEDAWARYLPPEPNQQSEGTTHEETN